MLLASLALFSTSLCFADELEDAPKCAETRSYCFGIELYVAAEDGAWVADETWIVAQLEAANQHFSLIDVGFEISEIYTLDEHEVEIETKKDRDLLGRTRFNKGNLIVFFVKRLANVDEEGDIWGVHWRDRENRSHRWIIVSSVAGSLTLTHEMGHYFGLGHGDEEISLMNKTPRTEPPYEARTFSESEQKTMRKHTQRHLKKGRLKNRFGE